MDKIELAKKLKNKGFFWSYSSTSLEDIPIPVLIEETLRWGDVPELMQLFKLYSREEIKKVWEEKLVPDERIYPHNYYLARVFFDIQNPVEYIKPIKKKYNRYERLKHLDA